MSDTCFRENEKKWCIPRLTTGLYIQMNTEVKAIATEVFEALGGGFTESVYHNAMLVGLREKGINYDTELPINVKYKGKVVGTIYADVVVYDDAHRAFVVELKAGGNSKVAEAEKQLKRYVRALRGSPTGTGTVSSDMDAGGMVVVFGESKVCFSECGVANF